MASRSDSQRAADVPKVERDQYEESVAAEAAEDVQPPAPEGAEKRAKELEEQAEAAEAQVDEDAPKTHVLKLDEDFRPAGADDGPVENVRVAFPGSHQVEGADEHGFVELSKGSDVPVTAAVANAASGIAAVKVEVAD